MNADIETIASHLKPLNERQKLRTLSSLAKVLKEMSTHYRTDKVHGERISITQCTYHGEWQIMRTYHAFFLLQKGCNPILSEVNEVAQVWLSVETAKIFYRVCPLSNMGRSVAYYKPLRQRTYSYRDEYSASFCLATSYGYLVPGSVIHPKLRRNGFRLRFFDESEGPYSAMQNILTVSAAETIAKSKMWYYAQYIKSNDSKNTRALMLMIRYGIVLSRDDKTLLLDTISLMERVGMEWRRKEVLSDLQKYHDIALRRIQKEEDRKKAEQRKEDEVEFAREHKHLLGIAFSCGGLNFHSLDSVREYYDEGKAMHHCVYVASYWKRHNALIMSIRNDAGKRLATLEYDVEQSQVVQCRAACNAKPEAYDDILQAFNDNINKFINPNKLQLA